MKTLFTLAASMLAIGAVSAHAGDDKTPAEKFAEIDADGDGVVTASEFQTAFEAKVAMKQEEGEWTDLTDADIDEKGAEKFGKLAGDDAELTLAEAEAAWAEKKDDRDWDDKEDDMDDDMDDAMDDMEEDVDDAMDDAEDDMDDM